MNITKTIKKKITEEILIKYDNKLNECMSYSDVKSVIKEYNDSLLNNTLLPIELEDWRIGVLTYNFKNLYYKRYHEVDPYYYFNIVVGDEVEVEFAK
jgi:hypothetical protein